MSYRKPGKNYVSLEDARITYNKADDCFQITSGDTDLSGRFNVTISPNAENGRTLQRLFDLHSIPTATESLPQGYTPENNTIPRKAYLAEALTQTNSVEDIRNLKLPVGMFGPNSPAQISLAGGDVPPNAVIVGTGEELDNRDLEYSRHAMLRNLLAAIDASGNKFNILLHGYRSMLDIQWKNGAPEEKNYSNDQFHLLSNLRRIYAGIKDGWLGDTQTIIVIDNMESLLNHFAINDSVTSRTDRAVRAEILSLIMDMSRIGRSANCHFIFLSEDIDSQSNGLLQFVNTRIAVSRPSRTASTTLFHSDVSKLPEWKIEGRSFIMTRGRSFSSFFQQFVLKPGQSKG